MKRARRVVVIGEAGADAATEDDPCAFGLQGTQVPASSSSHTWSLTLNACLAGSATLTARLYEVSDDPGDEDTELDTDEHTVTVEEIPEVTINGLAEKMQVGRSDEFTVKAVNLLASKTYRLTIGTVSRAVGFPTGTSGETESEGESPPVVVVGETGEAGADAATEDDPCAFGLQGTQVPANSSSYTLAVDAQRLSCRERDADRASLRGQRRPRGRGHRVGHRRAHRHGGDPRGDGLRDVIPMYPPLPKDNWWSSH